LTGQTHQEGPAPALVNFAWALLVSLHMHLQDNRCSELQQHLHIMSWLVKCRKRHLFPKSLAAEIDWFIAEGRRKGSRAGLRAKAEYIWHTATGAKRQQSDLRRLSFFFDALKKMGWEDQLVSDAEWLNGENMTRPLSLRLSQSWEGIKLIAEDCFLKAELVSESTDDCSYVLTKR
jgi:hypothetical protein